MKHFYLGVLVTLLVSFVFWGCDDGTNSDDTKNIAEGGMTQSSVFIGKWVKAKSVGYRMYISGGDTTLTFDTSIYDTATHYYSEMRHLSFTQDSAKEFFKFSPWANDSAFIYNGRVHPTTGETTWTKQFHYEFRNDTLVLFSGVAPDGSRLPEFFLRRYDR